MWSVQKSPHERAKELLQSFEQTYALKEALRIENRLNRGSEKENRPQRQVRCSHISWLNDYTKRFNEQAGATPSTISNNCYIF